MEIEALINEFHSKLNHLKVFLKEENSRWDSNLLLEMIRIDLNKSKNEYLKVLYKNFLSELEQESQQQILALIENNFSELNQATIERLKEGYSRILMENEIEIKRAFQGKKDYKTVNNEERICVIFERRI